MKNKVKSIISYGLPALIVMVLGLIILGVQGIWPFGNDTIDYYDMAQQVAAEYTQIWDELHGAKSMVFDWYTRMGREIPGGTYITLGNLFLYLIPRDMILEGFSILFILKTMCMATTMRIYLKKELQECPDFYSMVFSTGYGLCGFVLMQYTILPWLDFAALVPLTVMYAQRLFRDGKVKGFIILVFLMYMNGFYESSMVLLFLFLITGLYHVIYRPENSYITRLGISVFAGMMLAAFGWIPKLLAGFGSQRFQNEAGSGILDKYITMVTHILPDYSTRWWSVLGVSFAAAVTIVGMVKDLKNKNFKRFIFAAGSFVIVMAELVLESIQLFWHFGSYVNYPARNGYLICLVFVLTAATYANEVLSLYSDSLVAEKTIKREKVFKRGVLVGYEEEEKTGLNLFVGIGIVGMILLDGMGIYWYQSHPGMSVYTVFRVTMITVMATFLVYLLLLFFKKGRYSRLSVFLFCAEIIFYGVLLVGKPTYFSGYSEEPEQEGNYIGISYQIKDSFGICESRLDRIKNPDSSLNTNYGIIMRRATMANWTPNTNGEVFDSAQNLGYSTHYTRTLDSGGTVFSDALFHVTQVVSCVAQDDKLYKKISDSEVIVDRVSGESRNYSLYNLRYVLPFGVIIDDSLINALETNSMVNYYNRIYKAIEKPKSTDGDNVIARRIVTNNNLEPISNDGSLNTIYITGKKAVYFTSNRPGTEDKNIRLYVNDEVVRIPSIQENDNTYYPSHFNNNCVLLGCFENENLELRIDVDKSIDVPSDNYTLFTIDLDKLNELCVYYCNTQSSFSAGDRCINAFVNSSADDNAGEKKYLMIPVTYSKDARVVVNGSKTSSFKANALLTAIPIENGENNIQITYFPQSMRIGIIISIVTISLIVVCLVVICVYRKKRVTKYADIMVKAIRFELSVEKIMKVAYPVLWGAVVIGMYLVPIVYGCWYYISAVIL